MDDVHGGDQGVEPRELVTVRDAHPGRIAVNRPERDGPDHHAELPIAAERVKGLPHRQEMPLQRRPVEQRLRVLPGRREPYQPLLFRPPGEMPGEAVRQFFAAASRSATVSLARMRAVARTEYRKRRNAGSVSMARARAES